MPIPGQNREPGEPLANNDPSVNRVPEAAFVQAAQPASINSHLAPGSRLKPVDFGMLVSRVLATRPDLGEPEVNADPRRCAATIQVQCAEGQLGGLTKLSQELSQLSGWTVIVISKDQAETPSPEDTITNVEVITVDAEIIEDPTTGQPEEPTRAMIVIDPDRPHLGIVRAVAPENALAQVIASGHTGDWAAYMMDHEGIVTVLSTTAAFKNARPEDVVKSIQDLQMAVVMQDALHAAGRLTWAAKELLQRARDLQGADRAGTHDAIECTLAVANMLLTAMDRAKEDKASQSSFERQYTDLIAVFHRPLANDLALLSSEKEATAKDGLQSVFVKLLQAADGLSAANSEGGDPRAGIDPLLMGSLVLRHLTQVFSNPQRSELQREVVTLFAGELQQELVQPDPDRRTLLYLMRCCNDIAKDFFYALLTNFIASTENQAAAGAGAFGKSSKQMRLDGVECLLACGCMHSPMEFYGELDQKYGHSNPSVQAMFLSAMKFAVGERADRRLSLVNRALELIETPKGMAHYSEAVSKAKGLLKDFADPLLAKLEENGLEPFRALRPERRQMLLQEVLVPACSQTGRISGSQNRVLPLLMEEVRSGNLGILNHEVLRNLLTDDFVRSMDINSALDLRQTLLENYKRLQEAGLETEVKRIMVSFGFTAVEDAFVVGRSKLSLDSSLATSLFQLGASVAAVCQPDTEDQKDSLRRFVVDTVTPRFLKASQRKLDAVTQYERLVGDTQATAEKLRAVQGRISKAEAPIERIKNHPGFKRVGKELEDAEKKIAQYEASKRHPELLQEQQQRKASLLQSKFPDLPGKLAEFTMERLLAGIAEFDGWKAEAKTLEEQIGSTVGGQDEFTQEGWRARRGAFSDREDEVTREIKAASQEGAILRLFLLNSAVDKKTAQIVFDQLSPGESQAALTRMYLSLKHPLQPGNPTLGTDLDDTDLDEDGQGSIFDRIVDELVPEGALAATAVPEPLAAPTIDPHDTEKELAKLLSDLIKHPVYEDDVVGVIEGVEQLVAQKCYQPHDPRKFPVLRLFLEEIKIETDGKFRTQRDRSWGREANEAALRVFQEAYRALPRQVTDAVDRAQRAVFGVWIGDYTPPADLPRISSSAVLSAMAQYTPEASSRKRQLVLAFNLAKKVADLEHSLPPTQTCQEMLTVLELMTEIIPQKYLDQTKVSMNENDPPQILGPVLKHAIGLLKGRIKPRTKDFGEPAKPVTDLRLPFAFEDGKAGLSLPAPNRPALPGK